LTRINTGDLGDRSCESIVFDAGGNFYVGNATGNRDIHKYDAAWVRQAVYDVAIENVGSDWIDLAADQKTVYYTSEGRKVFRYDVDADVQLADFTTVPGDGELFALRILEDGSVLVANDVDIKLLDPMGAVVRSYDVTGENGWFSLNLDPDGDSFWSGSFETDNFYKFDIATGGMDVHTLGPINTGTTGGNLYGLTVYGERTAAQVISLFVDIKPTSCPNPVNTKSNGVLPVAILGTETFDVADLDVDTILLEGVAPLRWSFEDVGTPFEGELCDCHEEGADGYMDLMLHFSTPAIVEALGEVSDGEVLELLLTAMTLDEREAEGSDCIRILHKVKDPPPPPPTEIVVGTFNGEDSVIYLSLAEKTDASVVVYDVQGKTVKTLVDGTLPAGTHTITWDGTGDAGNRMASGIYFCRVNAGGISETAKIAHLQ
jgi:hypothetical protein